MTKLRSHHRDCAQRYGGECNCGAFEHNELIYAGADGPEPDEWRVFPAQEGATTSWNFVSVALNRTIGIWAGSGELAQQIQHEHNSSQKLLAFFAQIARLTKDRECAACGLDGDDENPACDNHTAFDMTSDDAVDTLHSLITTARALRISLIKTVDGELLSLGTRTRIERGLRIHDTSL